MVAPKIEVQKMNLRSMLSQKFYGRFAKNRAVVFLTFFALSVFTSELMAQNAFIAKSCFRLGEDSTIASDSLVLGATPPEVSLTDFDFLREKPKDHFSIMIHSHLMVTEAEMKKLSKANGTSDIADAVNDFLFSVFGFGSNDFHTSVLGEKWNTSGISGKKANREGKSVSRISILIFRSRESFLDQFRVRNSIVETRFNLIAHKDVTGQGLSPLEKVVLNQKVLEVEVDKKHVRIVTEQPEKRTMTDGGSFSPSRIRSIQEIRLEYNTGGSVVSIGVSNYKTIYGHRIPGTKKEDRVELLGQ